MDAHFKTPAILRISRSGNSHALVNDPVMGQDHKSKLISLGLCVLLTACAVDPATVVNKHAAEDLRRADRHLLEVVMEDVFSPPVASRVYMYPHIAHYVTLHQFFPDSLPDLAGSLKDWPGPAPAAEPNADPELAALLAFCAVGRSLVFTEAAMDSLSEMFVLEAQDRGLSKERIQASRRTASSVAAHMKPWMAEDGYVRTRSLDRFTSSIEPGHWIETSPDYSGALESHWKEMRPLLIPSASFYEVPPLPTYSTDTGSVFHKMVMEVYNASKQLSDSTRSMALYWDDNPNISTHRGHLVTMEHRISPPGHWLNIVSTVSRAEKADLYTTTKAYTLASIAMYDGGIACWHEKFRTDLVRPITYIQEYVQPDWSTLIQTPPFPEFPSGHSVTSAAAATVLSGIFGEDHSFVDSTEVLFGQGVRRFNSFQDAAWEVSLSRFYGGIHYMSSIREGNSQGKAVGRVVLERINGTDHGK